ncbi:EF-hand domain-containing protein [Vreelandella venusta]|uniref:EF-hand domain-containing protein n=1 Tax=Vreelandella venusta TaxID=44935 RepID=UPI002010B64B|nr:EF-hand domain-containing protein [Halomonas venusta]UQI41940.1 EF-hand domain-containing protein [Halomonas venusta]
MAQNYKTGLIITGDASGGIRAIKATDDELGKLNQGFERGSRKSKQFNQDVNATSQGLAVLRRAAAPIAGVIAGMFAANTLQGQINWADQLQKTNLRIGASTEALSQYNYVASLSGVEFNQLTTAWQRQTRRIAEAAAGTGVAVAALDKLNLSAKELNQLAPEEQFERIAAAMQGVENSSERVRLAQQLWDSEGVKLVQIVNSGTDAIAAMRAEADALGLTISQDTANGMATYNDEVDRLKFAAQGVSQTLLTELVPSLTQSLQSANSFIQEVGGAEVVVDHLTDAATVLAALMAGRYAGAFAAAGLAKLAATQQALAYQAALARMAGVTTTAIAGQTALAVATRGAAGALALVGGPMGAAMLAGGAIYYFREELGLVAPKVQSATDRVDDMTSALDANSEAALKNARAMLESERQFQQFRQATLAMQVDRQRQVVADEQEQWDAIGGQQAFGMGQASESQKVLRDLQEQLMDTRNAIEAAGGSVAEIDSKLEALENTTRETIPPTTDLGDSTSTAAAAAREAAKETTTLANSYEDLLDRIQPNRRAARQYAQDVGVLNLALATGRMTTVQYMQAMGMLQESFQSAQRETENTAKASEDASQRIANSFISWESVADNTLRRVDDSGQSLWLGLIDGSESALDTVKRGFQQSLAEIAHMLTTQKLTFSVAGMMGLDTTSMPGGGGGGFNLNGISSLYSGAKKLPYVGDAISGIGSALGFGGSAAAPSLAMQGGLSSAALASAGQVAGGATYGGWAGSAVSGAALGNSAGLASSIASGISTAMPWVAGGLAIDSMLGLGITDGITKAIGGLFGSKSRGPSFDLMTTHQDPNTIFEDVQHGVTATGAFGNVGFHGGNTNRLEETFGSFDNARQFLETIAATDDMLASLAPDDVEHMTYAIQQMRLKSSDAAGITEQLGERTKAAVSAMSGDFGAFIKTLEGGAEQIVVQAQNAKQAHDLLTGASERLGVQFNATGGYSYEVANGMAAMAGGVQSLETMYSSFYQNYYTEAERTAQKTKDVTAAFAALGFAMPENAAQFRELVLAQDTSTEAGRAAQVELLKLEGAFKDVAGSAGDAADASQLAAQRQRLNAQILRLQGDETAALTLERELELQGMDSSLHSLQQRKWALEDEQEANKEAQRAQQERIRTIEQEANAWQRAREQLASFGTSIASYIDGLKSTDKGLASPGDQLAAASAAFDEQYAKAASGDRAAMSSITQYADRLIEAQKGWSASGAQTVGTIDRVTGMLEQLPEMLSPEQFLADEFKGIIGEQTVTLAGAFDTGFGNAVDSLSRNFDQIDSNLDGLLTFSEIKRALGDKATDAQISALIAAVDTNGDGMISQQELANAKLGGLASGVAQSLAGSFDSLDANVDGLLTFGELKQGLGGLATDAQIRAMMNSMDLNNDGVINKLESVVIESMPNDARLTNVLRNQMQALGSKTLTSAQVKQALSPIATDAEINRLIKEVDANGDGIITAEELTAKRVSGIAGGVAASLSSSFAMLDKNLDDNLTFGELQSGLKGMATNAQIRAMMNSMDLNNDDVINKLESVVIESMPGDTRLTNVLRNQMQDLRTKTLTAQQVRAALSPIATDSEIDRLIKRVDINGDGVISAEENTAARVAGLADGIAGSLGPMFNSIDFDASGLIDYDEFGKQFKGMASDSELRKIYQKLDTDGDGQISRLEAIKAGAQGTKANTDAAKNASQGMRVTFADHQSPTALKGIGHWLSFKHKEAASGIGHLYAKQHYNWASKIGARYAAAGVGRRVDGSHAGGLPRVPFDGYLAELHKDESVLTADQSDALRTLAANGASAPRLSMPAPRDLPMPDIAAFPLLNRNDQNDVVRDMQRQIAQQNQEITRLLKAIEQHTGAAVDVQAEGAKQQISELQKANAAMDEMATAARLQGAR